MKATLLLLLAAGGLLSGCQKESVKPTLPERCTWVPDGGMCNAAMPKYYYDPQTGRCEEFTWGGCGGVVPFQTLRECRDCGCEDDKYAR